MHHNIKGLSLVEMLVSVVISTIILAAAYSSYTVISNNFNIQKDLKFMSQSARSVVEMIARDVRMGGYKDFNNAEIGTPIKITDSSNNCCDRIDIIYDKSKSSRVKISYYTKVHKNRNRLMKQVLKCNTPDCSSTSTVQAEQPIADYVEDLQFSGFKDGSVASTGAVEYGMGNKKWFFPDRVEITGNNKSGCQSYMGSISKAFDGDPKTVWQCKYHSAKFRLIFKDYVRIEKIKLHTAAHLDGGNYYPKKWGSNYNYFSNGQYAGHSKDNVTYPYGKNHNLDGRYAFKHIADGKYIDGIDTNVHKCLHKDVTKRNWGIGCTKGNNAMGSIYITAKEAIYNTLSQSTDKCDGLCSAQNIDRGFGYVATKEILLRVDQSNRCKGFMQSPSSECKMGYTSASNWLTEIPDIAFYGEAYGEPVVPSEVDIGLLLRSPNEHGSTNRSFSINLGNRAYSSNDLYLRDNYSTTVVARNVYYK